MKLGLGAITHIFKKPNGNTSVSFRSNPTLLHWKLLLVLFLILLIGVGVAGVLLYQHFILSETTNTAVTKETKSIFDEKKLDAVIVRFEKKGNSSGEIGTSTTRFIDPSVPF